MKLLNIRQDSMRSCAEPDIVAEFIIDRTESHYFDRHARMGLTDYSVQVDYPKLPTRSSIVDKAATFKARGMEVIFNPPATILYVGGNKYVSKAYGEDFDEEKGLLMCLAKAAGITNLELKRMIKNAKRPDKKSKNKKENIQEPV